MIYVYVAYIFLFPREKFSVILGSNLRREDFVHYVSTCFKEVGDRVKHWLTVNDPGSFAIYGYDYGIKAPGKCSLMSRLFCKDSKSSAEQ
jgi:hypothetical protein